MSSIHEATPLQIRQCGRKSTWTPEDDADLIDRRLVKRQKWPDIAFITGRSERACQRRFEELVVRPKRRKCGTPLHEELGIRTHIHRQALLADNRLGLWDEQAEVWSHNHLYRESITLAGA